MDKKLIFCDEGTDVGLDVDAMHEEGILRLEFTGFHGGCGHCTERLVAHGDDLLEYVDFHRRIYSQTANRYVEIASLIRKHGEERIAVILANAWRMVTAFRRAGTEANRASNKPMLPEQQRAVENLAGSLVAEGIECYANIGTFERMVVETFEPHLLEQVTKEIAKLEDLGYDV